MITPFCSEEGDGIDHRTCGPDNSKRRKGEQEFPAISRCSGLAQGLQIKVIEYGSTHRYEQKDVDRAAHTFHSRRPSIDAVVAAHESHVVFLEPTNRRYV